jgi:hypothetical protein
MVIWATEIKLRAEAGLGNSSGRRRNAQVHEGVQVQDAGKGRKRPRRRTRPFYWRISGSHMINPPIGSNSQRDGDLTAEA